MTKTETTFPTILVQAASRSWSGASDWCMNEINERPVVAMTIERALEEFPQAKIRIIAPEFDKGGKLDAIPVMFKENDINIYYGHDESPLNRMVAVLEDAEEDEVVIRIDGLHFAWLPQHARKMHEMAIRDGLDCVKMPDEFPCQLSADIYRVSALREASVMLERMHDVDEFKIHPKFFMIQNDSDFKCARYEDHPPVDDEWLKQCREIGKQVYADERYEVSAEKAIKAGDQFSFHYELAMDYIAPESKVLDCACGHGYGARIIAQKAAKVIAADIDLPTVRNAASGKYFDNITFQTADATDLGFSDQSFDAVTSFETAEHIDHELFFKEMDRVLKPGGKLLLSTPQNSLGHIPVNAHHKREFSLEEITDLCSQKFEIEKIIGIKQGRVVFEDDPKGQNTFIVCRKPQEAHG